MFFERGSGLSFGGEFPGRSRGRRAGGLLGLEVTLTGGSSLYTICLQNTEQKEYDTGGRDSSSNRQIQFNFCFNFAIIYNSVDNIFCFFKFSKTRVFVRLVVLALAL